METLLYILTIYLLSIPLILLHSIIYCLLNSVNQSLILLLFTNILVAELIIIIVVNYFIYLLSVYTLALTILSYAFNILSYALTILSYAFTIHNHNSITSHKYPMDVQPQYVNPTFSPSTLQLIFIIVLILIMKPSINSLILTKVVFIYIVTPFTVMFIQLLNDGDLLAHPLNHLLIVHYTLHSFSFTLIITLILIYPRVIFFSPSLIFMF